MKGRDGWCPPLSAATCASTPARTATTPLPNVANPKILGNQSDGNPILSCSASIHDSNVDVKSAVAIPLKNLPSTKNRKLEDNLHKQHKA